MRDPKALIDQLTNDVISRCKQRIAEAKKHPKTTEHEGIGARLRREHGL